MQKMENCHCSLWLTIAIGILPAYYFMRKYSQGGQFNKNIRMDGKIVIITGCNTGIGKETAFDMAQRGAKVYMACRDTNKCEEARQEIIEKTGNNLVFNRYLDLASLESVRNFVKKFSEDENRLDILINNAGLINPIRTTTKDNIETTFGVNHLGPFLLTTLLLDTLKLSTPSRIVNVTSMGHKAAKVNKEDLQFQNRKYSQWVAYTESKLLNILFTRELAKRLKGTGVTANSLHPGGVRSDFARNQPFYFKIFIMLIHILLKDVKSGAQTTIAVAVDPDYENVTGRYFTDCKIANESDAAKDDEMAEWLWKTSERLIESVTKHT